MRELPQNITVPAWVSCRTYFFGQPESRSYLSNEKRHTYILLEGLASDLWKLLADGTDFPALEEWARKRDVADQLEQFLGDLAAQGLIDSDENAGTDDVYEPIETEDGNREESKFVEEMQTWLYDNKFMSSLFFELTYRCNLKCVHCYNPKDCQETELDFETCKKAIDDAYDLGCFRVTFSGGESTLHSRFLELVAYARSKRMSVEIFTNGQLLFKDEELYRKTLRLYPYRICVSLYSTEKEMHERVTAVKGSFENTDGLIRRLRKDNVNVQIKNFLLNFNCMDCIKVKDMAKELHATSVADISLIPTIEGDKKTLQFELSEDDLFKLYTDPDSPLFLGKDFKKLEYERIKDASPCLGGFTGLTVNPNGEVVICVSLPLFMGNLHQTSLIEIWQAAMRKETDSALYRWQSVKISDCIECYQEDYCVFCNYCPGMGYLEKGYLKRSEVLCKQAKIKMRAYHYLKSVP